MFSVIRSDVARPSMRVKVIKARVESRRSPAFPSLHPPTHLQSHTSRIHIIVMKGFFLTTAVIALPVVLAVPHSSRDLIHLYDPTIPTTIFTDATCKLSAYLTPGQPFSNLYPIASTLGAIIIPTLRSVLGTETIEDIDRVADQLCLCVPRARVMRHPLITFNNNIIKLFLLATRSRIQPRGTGYARTRSRPSLTLQRTRTRPARLLSTSVC